MNDEPEYTIEEFVAERDAALLSMDEERIRSMTRKFNEIELPWSPRLFWGVVHKSITSINTLPLEFRRDSKTWLEARGYHSNDDGEL